MKCSRCGATCRDIKAMGAHYRKKHPRVMKAGKKKTSKRKNPKRRRR